MAGRVAVGGLFHESNTFCPVPAGLPAFAGRERARGEGLVALYRDAHHELGGFIEASEALGLALQPTQYAAASPCGRVTDEAFETICAELLDDLAGTDPDGIYLALHGAMVTETHDDAEGELLRRVRQQFGDKLPLVVTLDWHTNVSAAMVEHSDALVIYRTYPHLDQRWIGRRAGQLLGGMLNGELRPTQALAAPPLILNLKAQETSAEPMRSVVALADEMGRRPEMLVSNIAGGFPYADVACMGTTAVVVTNDNPSLAAGAAAELGDLLWAVRRLANVQLPAAAEAVAEALRPGPTPVVLVDYGDNVGGGSAADGTLLLRELLRQGATGAAVTLHAPDAVQVCLAAGPGGRVELSVGGTCDDGQGPAVAVTGTVKTLSDGKYVEPEPRHGGARFLDQGVSAVVDLGHDNLLVLTTGRSSPNSLQQLISVGIDPRRRRIVVAKGAIAPKAAYGPVAGRLIEVDTPGYTAVDPTRFEYAQRRRPMLPFEATASWPE